MMNTYEILCEKYDHCVSMTKKYLESSQVELAMFYLNAARGFYNKMRRLTIAEAFAA